MRKTVAFWAAGILFAFALMAFFTVRKSEKVLPQSVDSEMVYSFNQDGVLEEAGVMEESSSPYFWLNSGGRMIIKNGIGATMEGADLAPLDRWRIDYLISDPRDTDGGFHPQNLFRLVTRSEWQDADAEVHFVIKKLNLSQSPNRNQSNGVLLFARYKDSANLYYAGVRVDGQAVIKKKIGGIYYTLALEPLYASSTDMYDRMRAPNFIPLNEKIGLRFAVKNNGEGVILELFTAEGDSSDWKLRAEAVDSGKNFGGSAFTEAAYAGIRTDFMDVEFDDYAIKKI